MKGLTNNRQRNPELHARKVSPWSRDGNRLVRHDSGYTSSIWATDAGTISALWAINNPMRHEIKTGGSRSVEDAKRVVLTNLKRLGAVVK